MFFYTVSYTGILHVPSSSLLYYDFRHSIKKVSCVSSQSARQRERKRESERGVEIRTER